MPRHRRQRPAWLPSWIPYKDGRYLGLARQTILAWTSTILATAFYLMTIAYAMQKSRFSNARFVHSSRSNTIMVLRILSEAAGIFLAASVYSTFEIVQWVLISRPEGIHFPQFLALQSSTGALGLLMIALGKGLPIGQWPMKPRLVSLLRLIAEAAIPLTGVLVMSNVNTEVIYNPQQDTVMPMSFGMESFNGSVASQFGVMQDLLFNLDYVSFLNNPLHAVDITPDSDRAKSSCIKGNGLTANVSCARNVLITQEYQNVNANLPIHGQLEDDVVISMNQQIYSLEYRDNIGIDQEAMRCEDFTSGPGSYLLCTRNAPDGSVEAAMIPCPASLVVKKECASNTAWRSDRGFTTSLHASFLNASVSYQRTDGRILSCESKTRPVPVSIDSSDLMEALIVVLDTSFIPPNSSASNPILGAPNHFFGRLIAGHNYRISKLLQSSPEVFVRGANALQSLLAITLFYCQNGILAQTVMPYVSNSTATKDFYSDGAFLKQGDNSYVALAKTQYRIDVGRATLIAYIVLSGVTLLICIIALVIGSILELVKFDAEPTLWPALDFYTQCKVQNSNRKVLSAYERTELAWQHDGRRLFRDIEGLRITRRKRGHGPGTAPEPGNELQRVERVNDA